MTINSPSRESCATVVEITTKLFQSAFSTLRSLKRLRLELPGCIFCVDAQLTFPTNYFFMSRFIPFSSWWGISGNIEQRNKGSDVRFDSISFLTLIQLVFDMFAFTDNDKVIDQIITNNREVINKITYKGVNRLIWLTYRLLSLYR